MLIDLHGFSVRFGETTALDEVSFSLGEGGKLAVVGESGSGKSTLAKALLGLTAGGRIAAKRFDILGRDMRFAAKRDWRDLRGKRIGLMLQDPRYSLHPTMTVGRQIGETARRPIAECLEEVGLAPAIAARYPHQLSGGQGQRVFLAMTLALEPRLLIADEPTSALDPDLAFQTMKLIEDRTARHDMGLLLITHDIELAFRTCPRLLVMKDGRIVEELDGTDPPRHPFTKRLIEAIPGRMAC